MYPPWGGLAIHLISGVARVCLYGTHRYINVSAARNFFSN